MNKQILIVTGSVRPNSINKSVVPMVETAVEAEGLQPIVADLGKLNLPFIDTTIHPAQPEFEPPTAEVQRWTDMVAGVDGVMLVMPEYNHTMTPVQLNAVDWIAKQWRDKPVAIVSYGISSGGAMAQRTAREAFGMLGARLVEETAKLFLGKDLNREGEAVNRSEASLQIKRTVQALAEAIK